MSKKTVLIGDMLNHEGEVLRSILECNGNYKVVGMTVHGKRVCELFAELRPDLLIISTHLYPKTFCTDIIQTVLSCFPDARIIITSGKGYELALEDAFNRGARAHIEKPFVPSDIVAAVKAALD